MNFELGDYVEIVYVVHRENLHLVGERGIIVKMDIPGYFVANNTIYHYIDILPRYPGRGMYYRPDQLRKIDPPDWNVDVRKEEEVKV